jgi:hypothetical protein
MRRNGRDLSQSIADNAEERLVVAATVSGAGGEHECVRSGDVGGAERWDSDVRLSNQGSINGAEGGICCFLSIVGRLNKLDNNAAFGGRVGLLLPLGPPRNDGVPHRGGSGGFLGGGSSSGGRLCSGGCVGRLRGGCGRGRLLGGGGGGGRVTSNERGQLLRNYRDLLLQSSEVL